MFCPNGHAASELWLEIVQQFELLILVRNYCHRQWPFKTEARIVVHQAALVIWRVELADLVARLRVIAQRLITVGEALWHIKGAAVLLVQLDRDVLKIGRAFRTEV